MVGVVVFDTLCLDRSTRDYEEITLLLRFSRPRRFYSRTVVHVAGRRRWEFQERVWGCGIGGGEGGVETDRWIEN